MSKTPNQVIQNLENVLASLKTKTGKSQNNLTDVVSDMAEKPQRATTTIAAATTDKTNELKVSATNNQATGYVEGSSQSNDLTIGLSANGATVSAKWGNTVVATQKVTTIDRATTDIGTVANDTNDTLTITATNGQGTGYVVADSNKNTASKIVTLSIAKPTIDASGNVTAIATVQDNSTTPVKVSKTSSALALGIGSLSVSGNIVTTSAGYYSSATSATVAIVSRATTSLGSTATNNKLVFTATNNQGTGYVVASTDANNATAEVTLSVSGNVVTASHGANKISATVATVSRATISHNTAANDTNDTLTITSTSVQETGYVTGGSESATTIVTLGISKPSIDKNTGIVTAVATVQDNSTTPVKVEKTSGNLSLGLSSLSVNGPTVTSSEGFTTGGSATVEFGSVAATATVNSPSITLTPSAISLTNKTTTVSGKTRVAAAPSTTSNSIDKYYIAVEAGTSATDSTAGITATANANIGKDGYLYTSDSTNATASATASATISATTTTHYIPLTTGGYTVSGGGLTAGDGSATATMTATGMSLGATATVAPSTGPYIKVEGSGSVSRAAITATQSAGYIPSATTSQEKISSSSTTSNTATVYYPITGVDRANTTIGLTATNGNEVVVSASNTYPTGYVTGGAMSTTASVTANIDNTPVYHNDDTEYYTITSVTTVITGSGESATSQTISKTTTMERVRVDVDGFQYTGEPIEGIEVPLGINISSNAGYTTTLSEQTVIDLKKIEENLKPEYIKSGKVIFGVEGTYESSLWVFTIEHSHTSAIMEVTYTSDEDELRTKTVAPGAKEEIYAKKYSTFKITLPSGYMGQEEQSTYFGMEYNKEKGVWTLLEDEASLFLRIAS